MEKENLDPEMPADTIATALKQIECYKQNIPANPKRILRGCRNKCKHNKENLKKYASLELLDDSKIVTVEQKIATDSSNTVEKSKIEQVTQQKLPTQSPTNVSTVQTISNDQESEYKQSKMHNLRRKESAVTLNQRIQRRKSLSCENPKLSSDNTVTVTKATEDDSEKQSSQRRVSFSKDPETVYSIVSDNDNQKLSKVADKKFLLTKLEAIAIKNLLQSHVQHQQQSQMSQVIKSRTRKTQSTPINDTGSKKYSKEGRPTSSNPNKSKEKVPTKMIASSRRNQASRKKNNKRKKKTTTS